MSKHVAIVTDSTAYLPASVRDELGISMVPLNVVFGEKSFQEEIDLTTDKFYEKMKTTEHLPKTSQPAIGQFVTLFESLREEGYKQVVTIHLSSTISGTYQSALSAASMVEDIDVYGFDSEISCAPQGYYAIEAAKLAQAGADANTIMAELEKMKTKTRAYFMVDDLNHLRRGGRLSAAQLLVGNLLKIKPILHFHQKQIVPFEKVRTEKKALSRIIGLLEEDVQAGGKYLATVIHANREEDAKKLAAQLEEKFDGLAVEVSYFGPVIGTHLGAGSLGISWVKQS